MPYSQRDIAIALLVLVDHDGNAEAAARVLEIPARTLRHWRNHAHRLAYEHLREAHNVRVQIKASEELEETYRSRLERGIRPAHYAVKLAKLTEERLDLHARLAELDAVTTAHNTA